MTIQELEQNIRSAKEAYYAGIPTVDDTVYDAWEDELRRLDPHNPILDAVGSLGTLEPGRCPLAAPMLSQEKAKTQTEANRIAARFNPNDIVVLTEKLDGSGMDLTYIDGHYTRATSRGDWASGSDCTQQVATSRSIPEFIPDAPHELHIRGEIVIRKADFEGMNAARRAAGLEEFSNPRNTAASAILMSDIAEVSRRCLTFVAYEAFQGTDLFSMPLDVPPLYSNKLAYLRQAGFVTPRWTRLSRMEKAVTKAYALLEDRDSLPYQIDGVVVRLDSVSESKRLGATGHHPRYSFAVKPPYEYAETPVVGIDWTVSRNGVASPVVILKPVHLSGATIERANAHNIDQLEKWNIAPGTLVQIVRSGEVIPRLMGSDRGKAAGLGPDAWKSMIPTHDARTGSPLVLTQDTPGGERYMKVQGQSAFVLAKQAQHMLSTLRILGFGEELLYAYASASGSQDLFEMLAGMMDEAKLHKFLNAGGQSVGELYATKLCNTLKQGFAKPYPIRQIVKSLGIDHCQSIADKAAEGGTLNVANCLHPETYAPYTTPGILAYIKADLDAHAKDYATLLGLFTVQQADFSATLAVDTKLAGKTFVITGSFETPRKEIETLVKTHGGILQSGVNGKTQFLICGQGGGSKRDKAAALGVKCITEADFLDMIGR